jgi:hypothetical protein
MDGTGECGAEEGGRKTGYVHALVLGQLLGICLGATWMMYGFLAVFMPLCLLSSYFRIYSD